MHPCIKSSYFHKENASLVHKVLYCIILKNNDSVRLKIAVHVCAYRAIEKNAYIRIKSCILDPFF